MPQNGLILLTPTSIAYTGTSATISANGSVSFSAITELSLNGVFSADYDNYMITCWATASTPENAKFRFRQSGTDSTTGYTYQFIVVDGTSVSASYATTTHVNVSAVYGTQRAGFALNVYGPFLSQPTAMRSVTVLDLSSAGMKDTTATHSVVDSYDGFTLYPGSGNFTGRVAVYGMRK
jgi:hypothetical protein